MVRLVVQSELYFRSIAAAPGQLNTPTGPRSEAKTESLDRGVSIDKVNRGGSKDTMREPTARVSLLCRFCLGIQMTQQDPSPRGRIASQTIETNQH